MSQFELYILTKAIIITYFIIGTVLALFLQSIFMGLVPCLRVKKLSHEDKKALKETGISHKTTETGKNGICKDKMIRGTKGHKAYSNFHKKTAFFLANAYYSRGEYFNDNLKYKYEVKITNLSDEQIENMRIRSYDSAIAYLGDFKFEKENHVEYIDLKRPQYSLWEKFSWYAKATIKSFRPSRYLLSIIISTILAITVSYGGLAIILYTICSFVGI